MALRDRLWQWAGRLPLRIQEAEPEEGGAGPRAPLFERYFVGQILGVTVYLHHYVRSDPDRGLHDHPWSWAIALPLCGGYWEERLDGFDAAGPRRRVRRRRPGLPYRMTGRDFHRVVIRPGMRSSWSLFVHGPYRKGWGFLRPDHRSWLSASAYFAPHQEVNSGLSKWWLMVRTGDQQQRAPATVLPGGGAEAAARAVA